MADMEYFPDEETTEAEQPAEESSNRTFIILVGALGGLLALAICVFGVWAVFLAPRLGTARLDQETVSLNQQIQATNEAIELAIGLTATAQAFPTPEPTATPVPTDTPQPTATPTMPPTPTPTELVTSTPGELAQAGTPALEATQRVVTTLLAEESDVPQTGIGAVGASALAVGLAAVLFVVRRLRQS